MAKCGSIKAGDKVVRISGNNRTIPVGSVWVVSSVFEIGDAIDHICLVGIQGGYYPHHFRVELPVLKPKRKLPKWF